MRSWASQLEQIFTDNADRPYMIDAQSGRVTTYAELGRRAASIAGALEARGLRRGSRICVRLPNGPDFATLYFAALFGGLTVVPVNNALPQKDRAFILQKSRLSILVADGASSAEMTEAATVTVADLEAGAERDHLSSGAEIGRYLRAVGDDAVWSIHFTSGTTSLPKGVAHRVGGLLGNAQSFNRTFGIGRDNRFVHVMPMAYMAGFLNTLLGAFTAEASIVLAPQFGPQSALRFWEPVDEHGGDTIWVSPTMLATLTRLDRGQTGIDLCRTKRIRIFSATAPLSARIRKEFEAKYGTGVAESYGLSELLLITANDGPAGAKDLSVGPALPEVGISIRTPEGGEADAGCDGNIFVDTPYASVGYLDYETGEPVRPQVTWFDTGDVGHLDADGYLFVTGRVKDLIIRGGFNISPRQIEEVLLQHPDVEDVAVVGVPHDFYGEEVVAAIIPGGAAKLDDLAPELRSRCRNRLGGTMVPDRFVALPSFPLSSLGKVQKHKLRDVIGGHAR